MKPSIKAKLKQAKEFLENENYKKVLQICKGILTEDQTCFHAFIFAAKVELNIFSGLHLSCMKVF